MRYFFFALVLIAASASAADTHSIEEISDSGRVIILDDDSVWGVDSADSVDSSVWTAADDVLIVKTDDEPSHPYLLINKDEKETVHAKYMGKL